MKHTPEPWFLCKPKHPGPDQENDFLIHDEAKNHIAEVFQYQSHQTPNGPSEANAHLIKASPKMLKALEELFESLKLFGDDEIPMGVAFAALKCRDVAREARGECDENTHGRSESG